MSNITFVSAFLNSKNCDSNVDKNSFEFRLEHFRNLATKGIQLCVFISPEFEDKMRELCIEFQNVCILGVITLDKTWCYRVANVLDISYSLPSNRSLTKDTENYFFIMNSKTEFIQKTMELNPWNSTHFAWIDFSISYIFKTIETTCSFLKFLSMIPMTNNDKFFLIPGCKSGINKDTIRAENMNKVNWRFCGGFFIADKDSMQEFCNNYKIAFVEILMRYRILTWEVNVYGYLEVKSKTWNPIWYKGEHTDLMITNIPIGYFFRISEDVDSKIFALKNVSSQISYHYPVILNFEAGSASYLYYKGKHWLNTRYSNYINLIKAYHFPGGVNKIQNKNLVSELTFNGDVLAPVSYFTMNISTIDLPELTSDSIYSYGLEDIRLYEHNGLCKFIATSVNYSPTGTNRMVVGEFNPEMATYSNCFVLDSPYPNVENEKNWVPIQDTSLLSKERFVYQWNPFEIGFLQHNEDTKKISFIIESSNTIDNPFFKDLRGSTSFVLTDEGYVGLVHYRQDTENQGGKYMHMLILLDSMTYQPIKHSVPFVFCKWSIEYCIGMRIDIDKYTFWISQLDKNPLTIMVEKSSILIDKPI